MQIGLDFTLFIQLIQFLLIVLIVNRLIVQPIRTTYMKRDGKIKALNEGVTASQREIEKKQKQYDEKLQHARTEISEYQNQLKSEASARVQAIIDKSKADAQAIVEAGRHEIEKETAAAKQLLLQEINEFSKQIAANVARH